jgi:hypothetical protein
MAGGKQLRQVIPPVTRKTEWPKLSIEIMHAKVVPSGE